MPQQPRSNRDLVTNVAKAEDLENLLDEIGWTELILPHLNSEKEKFTKLLVASTLGQRLTRDTALGPQEVSKEQIAGQIHGIDYILRFFEKILSMGADARAELKTRGWNMSDSDLFESTHS